MAVWVAHDQDWTHARAFRSAAAAARYARRHPVPLIVAEEPEPPVGAWVARSPGWDRVRLFHAAGDAVTYAYHRRLLVEWLPLTPWWLARSGLDKHPAPPCRNGPATGHPLQRHR